MGGLFAHSTSRRAIPSHAFVPHRGRVRAWRLKAGVARLCLLAPVLAADLLNWTAVDPVDAFEPLWQSVTVSLFGQPLRRLSRDCPRFR